MLVAPAMKSPCGPYVDDMNRASSKPLVVATAVNMHKLKKPRQIMVQIGITYEEGGFYGDTKNIGTEYRLDEIILCPLDDPDTTAKLCHGLGIPHFIDSNWCFTNTQPGFMRPAELQEIKTACHYVGPILWNGDYKNLWDKFCECERLSAFHLCNLKMKSDGSYGDFSFCLYARLGSNGLDLNNAMLVKATSTRLGPNPHSYGESLYRVNPEPVIIH